MMIAAQKKIDVRNVVLNVAPVKPVKVNRGIKNISRKKTKKILNRENTKSHQQLRKNQSALNKKKTFDTGKEQLDYLFNLANNSGTKCNVRTDETWQL